MRQVAAIAFITMGPSAMFAEMAIGTNLTVLLDFEQTHSPAALAEMKSEVRTALRRTGVRLDLRLREEAKPDESFEDVVLVRFRGECRMMNFAPILDERGPLAWSHVTDGAILPFGEVACDRIRRAVYENLWGGQYAQKDQLLGRALGRVVAHELYHIIGGTHQHGKKGIAQASLSGAELIADRLEIDAADVARMRAHVRTHSRLVKN